MNRILRLLVWLVVPLPGVMMAALRRADSISARLERSITVEFFIFVARMVVGSARECWLPLTERKFGKLWESECFTHDPRGSEVLTMSLL